MSALDLDVARRLYHVETLHPAWCNWEVTCFYEVGVSRMIFSWDEHACNAMMYANGRDESDGYARPLPHYSDDLGECWRVIGAIHERGGSLVTTSEEGHASATVRPAIGPCRIGYTKGNLAEAVCLAFVSAYPVLDREEA